MNANFAVSQLFPEYPRIWKGHMRTLPDTKITFANPSIYSLNDPFNLGSSDYVQHPPPLFGTTPTGRREPPFNSLPISPRPPFPFRISSLTDFLPLPRPKSLPFTSRGFLGPRSLHPFVTAVSCIPYKESLLPDCVLDCPCSSARLFLPPSPGGAHTQAFFSSHFFTDRLFCSRSLS